MTAPTTAEDRARRLRRLRGTVAGLVASVGALVAHVAAGGSVEVAPGIAVLAVTIPLAAWLTRADAVAPARLGLVALIAQGVGHACLLLSPATGGHAHHGGSGIGGGAASYLPTGRMLLLHLLVALATAAIAAGVDRGLLDLARAIVGRLLPRLPAVVLVPTPARGSITGRVARLADQTGVRGTGARGPPLGVAAVA